MILEIGMKKELRLRFLRIVLAMTLGLILFPYIENIITKYSDEIIFLAFLFSSFVITIILIFMILKLIKKTLLNDKERENNLLENTKYLLRLVLLTVFVAHGLSIFEKLWIGMILIAIEIFGILTDNEFERNNKTELKN